MFNIDQAVHLHNTVRSTTTIPINELSTFHMTYRVNVNATSTGRSKSRRGTIDPAISGRFVSSFGTPPKIWISGRRRAQCLLLVTWNNSSPYFRC